MSLTNRLTAYFLGALALVLGGSFLALNALARYALDRQASERLGAALGTLIAAVEVDEHGLEWEPNLRHVSLDPLSGGPFRWAVRDGRGNVVGRSQASLADGGAALPALATGTGRDSSRVADVVLGGHPWRVAERVLGDPGPDSARRDDGWHYGALVLTVGLDLAPTRAALRDLAWVSGGVSLSLWVAAAALGRWLCRRAMVPVTRMAASVRAMGAAELDRRLPVTETGDEIQDLGDAFNGLLARLQEAFERQRRFTGDASHQLRTPLAAMLGQVEVALRRDRPAEDYRRTLATVRDQAAHLGRIVEMLLFLSRADAEAQLPGLEALELSGWARRHLESWSGHPRGPDLEVEAESDGPLWARVHPPLLGQLLDNLLDNASKYSEPGTPIVVRLGRDAGLVALTVEDRGCGIDGEDLPRIFDPFYRSPRARRDGRAGVGLGLAVAQRIATALGGSLTVRSEPGRGSRFTLLLPDAGPGGPARLGAAERAETVPGLKI
jgi:two-component system, OmpR family, sensor kinase